MSNSLIPPAPLAGIAPEPTAQARPEAELPTLDALSDCRYCWGKHPGVCPFIKVVEWHPSGQIARVVLKDRPEHEAAVVYPDDKEPEEK